jgi:hypothetical protein
MIDILDKPGSGIRKMEHLCSIVIDAAPASTPRNAIAPQKVEILAECL